MLLAEYLGIERDKSMRLLGAVAYFAFGEKYEMRMFNGKTYEFPELDVLLDIMSSEFKADGKCVPVANFNMFQNTRHRAILSRSDPLGQRGILNKFLTVECLDGKSVPDSEIDKAVEHIRQAVTMYNLTQSWDNYAKDNL